MLARLSRGLRNGEWERESGARGEVERVFVSPLSFIFRPFLASCPQFHARLLCLSFVVLFSSLAPYYHLRHILPRRFLCRVSALAALCASLAFCAASNAFSYAFFLAFSSALTNLASIVDFSILAFFSSSCLPFFLSFWPPASPRPYPWHCLLRWAPPPPLRLPCPP